MKKFKKDMFIKGNTYLETYKNYDIYVYDEIYIFYMVVKNEKILKSYIASKKGAKQFITRTINKNK